MPILPHVHYLRSRADCDALIAGAKKARRVVAIGASFIGLEVAASLRVRKLRVEVLGREAIPMKKIPGDQVGGFIRRLHEQHGVTFHLGASPVSIDESEVTLDNDERLDADLVVINVGAKRNIALAQQVGIAVDRGVTVDEYLQTGVPGIYAAGDIARWPDRLTGESVRSSTGWWPSARARASRTTCSGGVNALTQRRSCGPTNTILACVM